MIAKIFHSGLILLILLVPIGGLGSPLEVVIFGDSLSDTGNMFGISDALFDSLGLPPDTPRIPPSPPYAERFSNGPVWVDHLAQRYGAGPVNNAFLSGALTGGFDNFAVGGAYANSYPFPPGVGGGGDSFNTNDRFLGAPGFPGLQQQVELYSLLSGGSASATAWHVVWAGANDLVFADEQGSTAPQLAGAAVTKVREAIETLAGFGATEFLVPNIPDIGLTPFGFFSGRAPELSDGAAAYNNALELTIAELRATLGIDIMLLDTYALLGDLGARVLADPVGAGFPGGVGPCLDA